MIKLFLVEDEIVMRDGIKSQIDWKKEDIEFAGEASDGELAYPMILETRPDILLTDIKMPFMDGLELSALVRKELPDTQIIILSGYDEFSYAQRAVSLGVTEYLLKPLPPEELLACIRKVKVKIEQERALPDPDWREELLREQSDYQKQMLFRTLVLGDRPLAEILRMAGKLNMNISARYYRMILMTVREGEGVRPAAFRDELSDLLDSMKGWYFFDRGEDGYAVLSTGNDEKELDESVRSAIARLVDQIRTDEKRSYFIGVGESVNRVSDIGRSFYEANRAFSCRFLAGMNRVVFSSDLSGVDLRADSPGLDVSELVTNEDTRQVLDNFMRTGTYEEIDPFLEGVFSSIGEKNLNSRIFLNYLVMDIYFSMVRFLKEMDCPAGRLDEKCGSINDFLKEDISASRAREYLILCLQELIKVRDGNTRKRYGRLLREAVRYIDEHFDSEDISLNRVAEEISISPNHFSSIFSQEMGITFIEYLIQKRMERAKQLLRTTQLRSSEIAYQVGYRDPHYFSSTFRKTQGMTATEYRAGKGSVQGQGKAD
jgi:two-component system response regulator YesN